MHIDLQEDRRLLAAAQADPQEFRLIFACYWAPVFLCCVLRDGDLGAGEEHTGEVFAAAMAALPHYRWDGRPLLAWLLSLAARPRARRRPASASSSAVDAPRVAAAEACAELGRLLGRIEGSVSEALVLRLALGLSAEEVAQLQGVAPPVVDVRVYRAVARAARRAGWGDEVP